ncbi:hypothetical protein I4U23_022318 [Adineta vaga]|nr:hypothetical protein I4U23_022318 [Adineta vaga]
MNGQHLDTPKMSVKNQAISYNTCPRHDNEDHKKWSRVDVVYEGDVSKWNFHPFGAEENNRRGVSDMKGGIVPQIFTIEVLKIAGIEIKKKQLGAIAFFMKNLLMDQHLN